MGAHPATNQAPGHASTHNDADDDTGVDDGGWLLEFCVLATSKVISGLVTVHTFGDFVVLLYWEIRPLAP